MTDDVDVARHHVTLLAQALGRILVASGAVIDQPLTGPELLLAADDYATYLETRTSAEATP